MARIFVTGSADGLGLMAGQLLAGDGHEVVLHARNDQRADDTRRALPEAAAVVVGDLSDLDGMRGVAQRADQVGPFDAVIHNAGVGYREPRRVETPDGLSLTFAVNVLAPYVLTASMTAPARLVYLSSGMHRSGTASLDDLQWAARRWDGSQAYADSKLWDVVLSNAIARRWPSVVSSAVEPGWVPTRMGGPGAPDDLALGAVTQAWLAVGDDPATRESGGYWYHQQRREVHPAARSEELQDGLVDACASLSGVVLRADPGRRA